MPTIREQQLQKLDRIIFHVEERYDPEHDLAQNAPSVTYVDHELLEAIKCLIIMCREQEKEILGLRGDIIRIKKVSPFK